MAQEKHTPSPIKGTLAVLVIAGAMFVASHLTTTSKQDAPTPEEGASTDELVLIYSSDVGFNHVAGSSPCPQKAGAISIGTLAKTRSKLTELEVKGDIAPLIKAAPLAPSGEGVRITIMATYTCEVLDKGIYNGTIEATIKELESGREKHVSIPMSGVIQ